MSKLKYLLLFFSLLAVTYACSEEDDPTTNDPNTGDPNDPNNPDDEAPSAFTVTIDSITNRGAILSWTASTDPQGGDIKYSIEVDNTTLSDTLTSTNYTIQNQASGSSLSGKVIATNTDGETTESAFDFTTYVIDIGKYQAMTGFVSARLVDCNYQEGGSGQCYEITFTANNVDDDNTHLCPENINQVGGLGNYDGDGVSNGSPSNGDAVGFAILNQALFQKMENDGYDIIDAQGNINIERFDSGRPDPNLAYCLEAAPDDQLTLTFQVPVIPENMSASDNIESVEYVGLALDGTPINGEPPSVVSFGDGNIPSLDRCGGHQDPAGYYHWHFIAQNMNQILEDYGYYQEGTFECDHITQSTTSLMGYARDGYPIYSVADADGVPSDLDACNGHTGPTAEYPDGIYHYHASRDVPNIPPCIKGKQSRDSFIKPM
ncbi:YHYH protein [Flammeovirga sp. MY04]|uniref:YHYH protein n=1 Tax=Flammeovirga sp. MY04 TaxID=1191459 RepID=UPI000824D704|nr:YHYH protein [Flammeovirga sp. MY04]ANQ47477.2 YHYH protein [Flammeovirga sp. MY04]